MKQKKQTKRFISVARNAVMGVTFTAFGSLSGMAIGQESVDDIQEVMVTGSRIENANLAATSPITTVSADDISFTGLTRMEDVLGAMPQVYIETGAGVSNGATGTATLDLRNLGTERTLVLVNGRRLPTGSPLTDGAGADINQIPGALIKNVEILTGGASAVYGADAVAGVVNFLMVDDFEGFRFDYQYSAYSHDNDNSGVQKIVTDNGYPSATGTNTDGDTKTISFIMGGNFADGRGNVTAYASHRKIDAVLQSDRDYSSCALSNDLTSCYGSGTIPDGRITDFSGGFDFKVAGTDFVPTDGTTYNYGPLNYFQRPDERYTFGTFAHYDINDHAKIYTELMFMDDQTVAQIAPSGAFFVTDTLKCGNPLMSAQQFNQLCGQFGLSKNDTQTAYLGRRNVEGGNRQSDLRHTTFRTVFGVEGDIDDTWSYDLSYQYSEVSMEMTYLNDLSTTKVKRALDAVVHPTTGEIVCQSVVDGSDPNCVPWNIFTTGAVTQEQLDYLVLPLFARGTTDQEIVSAHISGNLGDYGVKLPGAEDGIGVLVGYEYRSENLEYSPDEGFRNGDGAGQGGAQKGVNDGYDVNEYFVEASVPLIQGKEFAEDISLGLAYRYSDYSTNKQTDTFGIRSGWTVNDEVKFRASFQRAVRAPNIRELFVPQSLALFDQNSDPCGGLVTGGQTAAGRTFEECARSGVTADQFGKIANSPAGQYNYLGGGNRTLEPEESDTFSYGFVWTPRFVDGLSLSVDYYSIEITKGIDNLTPDNILAQCLDGDLDQCALIKRGKGGDLWIGSDPTKAGYIIALDDNLAVEKVEGVDVIANYSLEIGDMGSLTFENVSAFLSTWDTQELATAPAVDCTGNWNEVCGDPKPNFQNNLNIRWVTPWNVTGSLKWRHISGVTDLSDDAINLSSVNYIDLAGRWDATESLAVTFGVNNAFDKEPPLGGAGVGDDGNGNVHTRTYDALGRYLFLGASVQF